MRRKTLVAAGVLLTLGVLAAPGCRTTYPARDPSGETFPTVQGEALDGTGHRIPGDFAGAPVLLLIGYEQDTQFDIDRWLLGLRLAEVEVATYELPTIPGMVPRMISATIDGGMRRGIPEEDWGIVITLYEQADPVARFTGNENRLPARVVLLDAEGRVVFFHDRGYSVAQLLRLREVLAKLSEPGSPSSP